MSTFGLLSISNFTGYTPIDVTPDSIVFNSLTNQGRSTSVVSNVVTVTGFSIAVPISSSGGSFKVDGGQAITSGFISPGQTLQAIVTTSANYSSNASVTINLNGSFYTFTASTGVAPALLDTIDPSSGNQPSLSGNTMTVASVSTGQKVAYCSTLPIPADGNIYYWEASSTNSITPGAGGVKFTTSNSQYTVLLSSNSYFRFTVQANATHWLLKGYTATSGTASGNSSLTRSSNPNCYPGVQQNAPGAQVQIRLRASEFQYEVLGLPLVAG